MTPLESCTHAAGLLKRAGFDLHYTSMKSEACYYRLPDRAELVRIAAHRHDRGTAGLGKIVARVTFPDELGGTRSGSPDYSEAHVQNMTASAIGWYMLRTRGALPYTGRQPRRTSAQAAL